MIRNQRSRKSAGRQCRTAAAAFVALYPLIVSASRAAPGSEAPGNKPVPAGAGASRNSSAPAQAPTQGYVLAIEGGDLIVDLGSNRGVSAGARLELWRPLKLVHPVTRRTVVDRYRIGTLVLGQVRPNVSLGKLDETPLRAPAPGDIVIAVPPEPTAPEAPVQATFPAASPPSNPSSAAGSPEDVAAKEVGAVFDSVRGQSPVARIRAYESYARAHPGGRFSAVLLEEAADLRGLVSAQREHELVASRESLSPSFQPPGPTTAGSPVAFGVELPGGSAGAVLEARNAGEVAYQSLPMKSAGYGYYVATIPAARVRASAVEYFIESVGADGSAAPTVGTADQPLVLVVDQIPTAAPPLGHENSVTLMTDFADYNRLKGNDHAWQTEGTFGMRFGDVGVRALRSGFGVYRGVGGSLHELDDLHLAPRSVGLTYGHLEGEFGLSPVVSLIARAVLGLGDDGTTGGAQLHVRIGSDRATNLLVGGEVLGGIGLRGITQLELEPRGRVPIVIRSEVTNQPAGTTKTFRGPGAQTESTGAGQVGIRGIFQVGYRLTPPLVLALRASYEGRTIDHAGPGFGGAMEYRW